MSRIKLTAGRVRDFSCASGSAQSFLWDTEAPGLAVRATANGAKSFVFQGKFDGKTIRWTIGDVRTWDIETGDPKRPGAREEARRLKALIDQHIDPRQQAAELKARAEAGRAEASRRTVTFGEAWPVYIEANKSDWGERHLADHVRLAALGGEKKKHGEGVTKAGPLAPLFPLLLSDLNSDSIAAWLENESAKRPTSTALSYRLLRAFIRWTHGKPEYRGLIEAEAYTAKAVKKALPKGTPKDDCLQREQLPVWFDAVQKLNNQVISAYLQALLITGARREELAGLRWKDVDFKWKSLTIRDKVEGKRIIPLTPYVASLLQDLKRRNETPPNVRQLRKINERGETWDPSPWVFFSRTAKNGRLSEPRTAHNSALEIAGLPHISLHGLRRTFGTMCEWVEVPTGISAQIMGHKPSAIAEKHYRRRPLDMLRMWHIKIEAWMLEQAGIEQLATDQGGLRVVNGGAQHS